MSRLVLAAALVALASLQAAAQSLPPLFPFQGPAYEGFPCRAFQPNPDGSWTVVEPVTIPAENGLIELSPGGTTIQLEKLNIYIEAATLVLEEIDRLFNRKDDGGLIMNSLKRRRRTG